MIPVATEKAGLPDDWSVLGAAVFAGIGVVVVRPHLYSIRSPPQGIVVEGTVFKSKFRNVGIVLVLVLVLGALAFCAGKDPICPAIILFR